LDKDALVEAFESNARCKECNREGTLSMTVKTVCLASSLVISCTNRACGYIFHAKPAAQASVAVKRDNRERSTDYAINVLYVLGLIGSGDGCTEAGRLLGLLGLPNDTTMESRSFTIIEERIGPAIRNVTDNILHENLIEEVKLSMERSVLQDDNDFHLWNEALDPLFPMQLSMAKYGRIDVSYDMAWQQRSSGHRYNSPSGHALFVGALTRKPIALVIKSKVCTFCSTCKKKHPDLPVPVHECWKTHDGSSKAMEPIACLELTVDMFDKYHVIINSICLDDDASTRSLVRWSNEDYMINNNTTEPPTVQVGKADDNGIVKTKPRPNKGRLPGHIPEPSWVADPNHRRKVLTGELIALAKSVVSKKHTMTRMDSTRLGKNFGYMIRTLNTSMNEATMVKLGQQVLGVLGSDRPNSRD
jgi:hypothetical protein